MGDTKIEWADVTWNPVTGCQKVSQGCKHCYAEKVADRLFAMQYPPVLCTRCNGRGGVPDIDNAEHRTKVLARCPDCEGSGERARRFTDVMWHPDRLEQPLRWRKPRRVFVNSMSDLFHEDVPDDFIALVFAVMALAPQHQFLVLTKRPERMRLLGDTGFRYAVNQYTIEQPFGGGVDTEVVICPADNVWLGVSVEDQETADDRVPILLDTPAAIRFVSYEPALGPVDFSEHLWLRPRLYDARTRLDWVIVGGESGPGARLFDIEWARDTIAACRAAGVPVFVKQLGARPWSAELGGNMRGEYTAGGTHDRGAWIRNRKGGDPDEWPKDLRVREFPASVAAAA